MFRYPIQQDMMQKKRALKRELLEKEGLIEKRIAILSGTTVGEIKNILELFLLDQGIRPVFFEGNYGRYYEEIVFDNPKLSGFKPDILFIHTGIHNIDNMPFAGEDKETAEARLSMEWEKVEGVLSSSVRYNCPVIINNFELPSVRIMGNREAYDPAGKVRFINRLNERIADYAENHEGMYINDINYLSSWYGLERWSDPGYYNSFKYGLNPEAIPLICLSVSSIIKALFGKNKKALLLDLDNTLWNGVIGDDGVEGIKLGIESPDGIAYTDLQRYAKELSGIGVLLGVVSKNQEDIAREGFSHPSSELSPEDFSVFYANWKEKSENLKEASELLNVGSDFFVFLDDNPVERELVENAGLGVEVADYTLPELLPQQLSMSGYFEVVALSEDDRKRTEMYRENAVREAAKSNYSDYGIYLQSLGMKGYFSDFSGGRQSRITQLANKTNQFNLTTRRYTQGEIAEVQQDDKYIKIAVRLTDKFGDNGIVTELIAGCDNERAEIEMFLMSCRVFKRDLELAVFDELVKQAKKFGIKYIDGLYIKTEKNEIVKNLYPSLGFVSCGSVNGGDVYRYEIPDDYQNKNQVIEVLYE